MEKINKFLKYLWLINGFIFLIWAWFSIYPHFYNMFKTKKELTRPGLIVGEKLEQAKKESIELQGISLEKPFFEQVNDYLIIPVTQKFYKHPLKPQAMRTIPPTDWHPAYSTKRSMYNNLIFFNKYDKNLHLLFEKKVLITSVAIPREDIGNLIYYTVIENDTNNDGMLYYGDVRHFYTSDLSGRNLKKFEMPDGLLRYVHPEHETGDLIIFLTVDSNKDGEYTEHDQDIVLRLKIQNGKYEEIVDLEFIEKIRKIAFN